MPRRGTSDRNVATGVLQQSQAMRGINSNAHKFVKIYRALYKQFGPQRWWPGDTAFEVIVGAILTQNTAWANVEKAIKNLKAKNLLTPRKMRRQNLKILACLIRPAGYFNIKAKRLKNFLDFLFSKYHGRLADLFALPLPQLRQELLSVNGIGPETADSIILYAANKPVFVVDAYTKRIFQRHGLLRPTDDYSLVQGKFMRNLRPDVRLYNEYHALIVRLGKDFCRTTPRCEACPIRNFEK